MDVPASVWSHTGLPVLAALAVATSAVGAGLALLRAAAPNRRLSGTELMLALPIGLGTLGYAADLIFMTGHVSMPRVYFGLVAIGLAGFVWHLRHLPGVASRSAQPWPDRVLGVIGWGVVAWAAVKLLAGNITPVNDNDSFYHYGLYSQSLAAGVTFTEILVLKNFPMADLNRILLHVYGAAGSLGGASALHLMNFTFIAAIAMTAHALCVGVLRVCRPSSPVPALAVLTVREIVYTGSLSKLDYGVAMFELTALTVWMTWRDRRRWMLMVGLAFAICARTNSLRFAMIIPVLWVIDMWVHREPHETAGVLLRRIATVGAGTILVAMPAYAMHQYIYGNPLFPIFNGLFGHYTHYYEWILLETLRYRTEYGLLGPVVVWVQMTLWEFTQIPGLVVPPATSYSVGLLVLLAPLGFKRDRRWLWLVAFMVLGYLTWWVQAHTHRTLLSVLFVAAILAAAGISAWGPRLVWVRRAATVGIIGLAAWTASALLEFNMQMLGFAYAKAEMPLAEYHDTVMPRLFPNRILPAAQLDAIHEIVGDAHLAALNLSPFSDPRLIRTRRLSVSGRPMAEVIADPAEDAVTKRMLQGLLDSDYLNQQAKDIGARLWPADGQQVPLRDGADLHWYLTASYDALQHIADDLFVDPSRMAPMLRFEGIGYFLAQATSVYGTKPFDGLTEVWRSDTAVLFKVENAAPVIK